MRVANPALPLREWLNQLYKIAGESGKIIPPNKSPLHFPRLSTVAIPFSDKGIGRGVPPPAERPLAAWYRPGLRMDTAGHQATGHCSGGAVESIGLRGMTFLGLGGSLPSNPK